MRQPPEDQWAFLSTLDRLSPGTADRIAREAGAGLSLDAAQLTPAALSTFKHAAAMANPKFYELQRLRKSTWDTHDSSAATTSIAGSPRVACGNQPNSRIAVRYSSRTTMHGIVLASHETPAHDSDPKISD